MSFPLQGLECKLVSQEIPGLIRKFGFKVQNEAGQRLRVLPRECTSHSKHPLPTTQETSPDSTHGHHQTLNIEIRFIIFFAAEDGETIQSAKTRLGADCGSYHELLIAKFRLKLNKVGKTTRPFRYDLNQIPYDYTVEMTNGSRD